MRNRSQTAEIAEYENAERAESDRQHRRRRRRSEGRSENGSPARVSGSKSRSFGAYSTDSGAHWVAQKPVFTVFSRIDAICDRHAPLDRAIALKNRVAGSFVDHIPGDIPPGTVFVTESGPDGTRNGRFEREKRSEGPLSAVVRSCCGPNGEFLGSPGPENGRHVSEVACRVVSGGIPPEFWVVFSVDGRLAVETCQFRSVSAARSAAERRLVRDEFVFRVVRVVHGRQRSVHVLPHGVHVDRVRQFVSVNGMSGSESSGGRSQISSGGQP